MKTYLLSSIHKDITFYLDHICAWLRQVIDIVSLLQSKALMFCFVHDLCLVIIYTMLYISRVSLGY